MNPVQLAVVIGLGLIILGCIVREAVRLVAARRAQRRREVFVRLSDARLQLAAQRAMARLLDEARQAMTEAARRP